MSDRPPPPLAALRAFAAAGRLESLKAAARLLGVTPSAVSHQVRTLEAWVGAPLFLREARQVRLTAAGRRFSERLNGAFDEIDNALQEIRQAEAPRILRISALPLFTSVYLIPRLHRFEARRPDVAIQIDSPNRLVDFDKDPVDLAIRNAGPVPAGLISHKLLDLRAVPLCAPELAADLTSPADLAGATLIHISARPGGWPAWFKAQGLAGLEARSSLTVDTLPMALDLAAHGRGVMLGVDPIVWDAPQAQKLVTPFASAPVSAGSYVLVHRREDRSRESIQAFVQWLRRELRADAARYARLRSAPLPARP